MAVPGLSSTSEAKREVTQEDQWIEMPNSSISLPLAGGIRFFKRDELTVNSERMHIDFTANEPLVTVNLSKLTPNELATGKVMATAVTGKPDPYSHILDEHRKDFSTWVDISVGLKEQFDAFQTGLNIQIKNLEGLETRQWHKLQPVQG